MVEKGLWSKPPLVKPTDGRGFVVLASSPCPPLLATAEYGLVDCPDVSDRVGDGESSVCAVPSGLDDGRSTGRV